MEHGITDYYLRSTVGGMDNERALTDGSMDKVDRREPETPWDSEGGDATYVALRLPSDGYDCECNLDIVEFCFANKDDAWTIRCSTTLSYEQLDTLHRNIAMMLGMMRKV